MIKASMQDAEYQNLTETSWRRPLTAAERTRLRELLAAHPDWREPWNEDAALNGLLRRLPGAAVDPQLPAAPGIAGGAAIDT